MMNPKEKKTLTSTDKISNLYKIAKEKYEELLHTETYKKANSNITKTINHQRER